MVILGGWVLLISEVPLYRLESHKEEGRGAGLACHSQWCIVGVTLAALARRRPAAREREFFVDNLRVRIHYIIVMIKCPEATPHHTSKCQTPLARPVHLIITIIKWIRTSVTLAALGRSRPEATPHHSSECQTPLSMDATVSAPTPG